MKKLKMVLLAILILLSTSAIKSSPESRESRDYKHEDFISDLCQENCYLCGNGSDLLTSSYWSKENVGILNLNTFELLRIEINRYNDSGQLIEKVAGYTQSSHMSCGDSNVHVMAHPDNGYAHVQISGVKYQIDRKTIQSHLCQTCLDTINDMWFSGNAPAEYAIVSFDKQTIHPLLASYPWFSAGNFGVDCEFNDNGEIDLLIHYCPSRYSQDANSKDASEEAN